MNSISIHPQRTLLTTILHERILPVFRPPFIVRYYIFTVSESTKTAERNWIDTIAKDAEKSSDGGKYILSNDDETLIFERHGEFSTYFQFCQFKQEEIDNDDKFAFGSLNNVLHPWIGQASGELFRTVEFVFTTKMPDDDAINKIMHLSNGVSCDVFEKKARIWTDFYRHEDDAGRVLVYCDKLKNDEASRLLQTLIEIGQYRKLALLGFPIAREKLGWLKSAEEKLNNITTELDQNSTPQNEILNHITKLAAEVESAINEVRFRFGATEAYYRLTKDRLKTLRESPIDGYSTMQQFIERRLTPAMRTCEATKNRLQDLSERIGRVNDLLRTRISISLELQNQELLKSMNRRSELQVKLSELVEGLSIFAIGYYVFNLLKYFLESAYPHHEELLHRLNAPLIAGILAAGWLFINMRKKSIKGGKD